MALHYSITIFIIRTFSPIITIEGEINCLISTSWTRQHNDVFKQRWPITVACWITADGVSGGRTDAAIKNQTASSSYKPALLDCGIKINVPPFIESGEKIIIDTRTLEYVKRVNWWD